MTILKKYKIHFILIFTLIIIAVLTERIVFFYYDPLRMQPLVLNRFLTISPVYNENGSWLHGRLDIGYTQWLLILENLVSLLVIFYLIRMIDAWNCFFHLNRAWIYVLDFEFAATLYRLLRNLHGTFTLDYFDVGRYVYDFPDLYIGLGIAGYLLWFVPAIIKYYQCKHRQVKGMNFIQKFIWEFKIAGMLCKVPFLPKRKWQSVFDAWNARYEEKETGR